MIVQKYLTSNQRNHWCIMYIRREYNKIDKWKRERDKKSFQTCLTIVNCKSRTIAGGKLMGMITQWYDRWTAESKKFASRHWPMYFRIHVWIINNCHYLTSTLGKFWKFVKPYQKMDRWKLWNHVIHEAHERKKRINVKMIDVRHGVEPCDCFQRPQQYYFKRRHLTRWPVFGPGTTNSKHETFQELASIVIIV